MINIYAFGKNELLNKDTYLVDKPDFIRNGNMQSDIVAWENYEETTTSYSGGAMRIEANSPETFWLRARQSFVSELRNGDKVYLKASYRGNPKTPGTYPPCYLIIYLTGNDMATQEDFDDYGNWQHIDGIYELSDIIPGGVTAGAFMIALVNMDANIVLEVKQVVGVNLTLTHGEGNEPDLALAQSLYGQSYSDAHFVSMHHVIRSNMVSDYGRGLMTARQERIAIADMYDEDGNRTKNWNEGEILNVGDCVRIDADNGETIHELRFNGNTDYAEMSYPLSIFNKSFRIEMMIYHEGNKRGILFGDYGLDGMNVNFEMTAANKLRLYWNGAPDLYGLTDVPINRWVHIAVERDKANSKVRFYVDNVLDIEHSNALTDKVAVVPFWIGKDYRDGATAFKGKIKDLKVFSNTDKVVDMKINEGSGDVLHDTVGNNDVIIHGATWESETKINSLMKNADGTPRYFRITGRGVNYTSVPTLELEYLEVK